MIFSFLMFLFVFEDINFRPTVFYDKLGEDGVG